MPMAQSQRGVEIEASRGHGNHPRHAPPPARPHHLIASLARPAKVRWQLLVKHFTVTVILLHLRPLCICGKNRRRSAHRSRRWTQMIRLSDAIDMLGVTRPRHAPGALRRILNPNDQSMTKPETPTRAATGDVSHSAFGFDVIGFRHCPFRHGGRVTRWPLPPFPLLSPCSNIFHDDAHGRHIMGPP
jgi:hypothetical protein